MKTHPQIAKQFKKHLKATKDGLSKQYQNTADCQAFYAGDMMDFWIGATSTDAIGTKKRSMVQINKVKPVVNAVKGFAAQNRKDTKYNARVNGDKIQQAYSDYANGLASYMRSRTYADQKETQMDGDMLINGYGSMETALTYTNGRASTDPNGQVVMGRLDPLCVGWDPHSKETNLLDARWVFSEQVYDISDALELFQEASEDDFETDGEADLQDGDDGYKYYYRGGRYNKIKETSIDWSDQKAEKVKVYFYQWFEYESFYRCDNPLFTQTSPLIATSIARALDIIAQEQTEDQDDLFAFNPRAEILSFDEATKKKIIEQFGDALEIQEQKRKVYYSAVVSKDHIFTAYRNICQQGYTIKFKTGDYDSKNKIWTGLVNSMMEPVLYYNKALTELMYIIGANSKGGVLYEEDAVDDPVKFEQQYAKTDAAIMVNSGAISGGKIKPKREPFAMTGYESIVSIADKDIEDVSIDKTFLGSSENKQEVGIVQKRRIRQVMSGLACYFDSITLYQIEHSRLLQDFMYVYAENNAGGQFSILGKDGKIQFMQISRDKLVAEYDVTYVEGPTTPEDKQEYAVLLQSMAEKIAPTDPNIAKLILAVSVKYMPIEYQDQQQIMQALVPPQGAVDPAQFAAMQKQLEQMHSALMQAQLAETTSKTQLNSANAALAQSKIPVQAAEVTQKKADAFHKIHEAVLDEYVAKNDPTPQITM